MTSNVILQTFTWNSWRHHNKHFYRYIQTKSHQIKQHGFDSVYFPPMTKSVSPQGYLPLDYYDLNSQYGNVTDLKKCIKTFHDDELDVYGDVVLNHRCAEFQNNNGIYNVYGGKLAWSTDAIVCDDQNFQGTGHNSSGMLFHAAPNIDHSQDVVKRDIIEWLLWLKTYIGYDGFRFDFVVGFDGNHVKDYLSNVHPRFAIGEYWDSMEYEYDGVLCYDQNRHRQRIINWIDSTGQLSNGFDITTKGILQEALARGEYWRLRDANNKPTGTIGWWPEKSVTFLDNHDTHCDCQNHWSFPNDHVVAGYAYILTHPGIPMVYWNHLQQFRDDIINLIHIRKKFGLRSDSKVEIIEANCECYKARIDDKLEIQIGNVENFHHNNVLFKKTDVIIKKQYQSSLQILL